jgi:hypothetical protein
VSKTGCDIRMRINEVAQNINNKVKSTRELELVAIMRTTAHALELH